MSAEALDSNFTLPFGKAKVYHGFMRCTWMYSETSTVVACRYRLLGYSLRRKTEYVSTSWRGCVEADSMLRNGYVGCMVWRSGARAEA